VINSPLANRGHSAAARITLTAIEAATRSQISKAQPCGRNQKEKTLLPAVQWRVIFESTLSDREQRHEAVYTATRGSNQRSAQRL
jgi:hypothetical protein